MATKVHMEALSPTMEEGQLVRWLKAEGDTIAQGDVLAEIETDKATMELVARGEGVLRKIFLGEGGTAPVGEIIAVIAAADEDISGIGGASGGTAPVEERKEENEEEEEEEEEEESAAPQTEGEEPEAEEAEAPEEAEATEAAGPGPGAAPKPTSGAAGGGRVKASPLARRLAADLGVELGRVEGSGPGGRIVKRDVEAAKESGSAAPAPSTPASAPDETEYEDVPVSQMRKTIAKRLVESIGPVPHFFLTIDVDMTRILDARASINAMLERSGQKVSINDIVLKSVAGALRRHPECNAHWQGTTVRRFNAVHVGVAVAVDDGLITPVVRNAHVKGIAQIGAEVRELAGRAREKKLMPDEYTGATFSVSNLGMFGIHEFTAIINPPEAGILAIGGVEETPVVVDGEIVVRPRMRVTMSCDHRVIDGASGSKFLQTLKTMLEEPTAILV